MNKIKKIIKNIYTKILVENYMNFILTVIAILLFWNVMVLDERGWQVQQELWTLGDIETDLAQIVTANEEIAFQIGFFLEEVYEK
jgi:hypothetical protein